MTNTEFFGDLWRFYLTSSAYSLCWTIAKIGDQEKVDIITANFRFPLGFLSKMLATLIEYETPKVVTVHNVSIGALSSKT